jgi:hypothetical protein
MLALAVLIAPFAHCVSAIDTQVPVIDFVIVIFKTINVGITVIKILDACAFPMNIWIIVAVVLIPVIAPMAL